MLKENNVNANEDRILCSANLFQEINEERLRRGEEALPEVNACPCGNNGTIARKDKSWGSVPEYFLQQFRKEKDK